MKRITSTDGYTTGHRYDNRRDYKYYLLEHLIIFGLKVFFIIQLKINVVSKMKLGVQVYCTHITIGQNF